VSDLPEFRFEPLEEFAAIDEPGAEPLATATDGGVVIPVDGDVLVFGDGGSGKTSLVLDLCWVLAAGGSWLGLVETNRPLRVAIVENEGSRPEFRRKLRAKLAATGADLEGRIAVLAEPWAALTLANEQHRRALALWLHEQEADLLVVGPLVSAGEFPNGGTPAEIFRFEEHTRSLRALLDRQLALVVIHHENKQGQVSGGWGRFGDTHLHLTAQGNGRARIFWAKAKWASSLHKTTSQLAWADGETFTVEAKPELTEETMLDALVEAVRANPGASWTKIRDSRNPDGTKRVRGNLTELQALRDRLLETGVLVNVAAREGQFDLWTADDPACPRSGGGTALERLPFPPAASEADPESFPVPVPIGNGGTERTDAPLPDDAPQWERDYWNRRQAQS
jgi:AAA domain